MKCCVLCCSMCVISRSIKFLMLNECLYVCICVWGGVFGSGVKTEVTAFGIKSVCSAFDLSWFFYQRGERQTDNVHCGLDLL